MTLTLATVSALAVGAAAIVWLPRMAAASHPGLESLCRWICGWAAAAGMAFAVWGSIHTGYAAGLGCSAAVLAQLAGWTLFITWMPKHHGAVCNESDLIRVLSGLADVPRSLAVR